MPVILTFYRNFLVPCSVVSIANCVYVFLAGGYLYILGTLGLKVFTTLAIGLYYHLAHRNQLYFFNNLGFSATRLYTVSFLIDIVSWLIACFLILTFHDLNI